MTGGIGAIAALPLSMQSPTGNTSCVAGAAAYSVDSFSEHSAVAVNRQSIGQPLASSLHQQQLEEELFRDLFASDAEPETAPTSRKSLSSFRPSASIQWATGATPAVPFPFPQRPPGLPAFGNEAPAIPKLNLSELVIPRPHVEDPSAAVAMNGRRPSLLGQVVEEADEDEDDDRPETDLLRDLQNDDLFPPFQSTVFRSARSSDNTGRSTIEQETLRFLERLDLRTVLHTPRPEIDRFFPAARLEVNARVDSEEERDPGCEFGYQRFAPPPLGLAKEAFVHRPPARSARKGADHAPTDRLAHMESTYGTTKQEPRKARRETFERLANPISGYSSTLQALSPEQRRKREKLGRDAAVSDNNRSRSDRRAESPEKATSNLLKKFASIAGTYHIAAVDAGAVAVEIPATSNNQLEDQLSSFIGRKSGDGGANQSGRRATALNARKEALKKKLRGRSGDTEVPGPRQEPAPTHSWITTCSTFLTQHEDEEAELMLPPKSSRPVVPPLQAAQQIVESMSRSRRTPRGNRTPAASLGAAALDPAEAKTATTPLASSRKRPSRSTRVTCRDKSDDNKGGATVGRKVPHPPPRPSDGSATRASTGRRPNPRQARRKTREGSPSKVSSSAVAPPKQPRRASIAISGVARSSSSRNQESTPSKAPNNRSTTLTAASILMGKSDSATVRKPVAREGRSRRARELVKSSDQLGAPEPPRGPRVRLVTTRRLSNGGTAAATTGSACRSDQRRAQSPYRGGYRANGTDCGKTGRKTDGLAGAPRIPVNKDSARQHRTTV